MSDDPQLYAWIGEDEYGRDGVGIKLGYVPAGLIPLVGLKREKIGREDIVSQLQAQADRYGKPIRLVRYTAAETIVTLTPRSHGQD